MKSDDGVNPIDALNSPTAGKALDWELEEGIESAVAYDDGEDFTKSRNPSAVQQPVTDRQLRSVLSKADAELQVPNALAKLESQQTQEAAREALAELYGDEFDLRDPPKDIDRFEKTLTLYRLSRAVVANAEAIVEYGPDNPQADNPRVQHSMKLISEMQSYGELAEQHLAALTVDSNIPMPISNAAVEALSDVRNQQKREEQTVIELVKQWLRGQVSE